MKIDNRRGFRVREGFTLIAVVLMELVVTLRLVNFSRKTLGPIDKVSLLRPIVEVESTVGPERTAGEATAWNNARKLAVDGRGQVHAVYQYDRGPGGPDLLISA